MQDKFRGGWIPYQNIISIKNEMDKLVGETAKIDLTQTLLANPPKEADPGKWNEFVQSLQGNPKVLFLAGAALVGANIEYANDFFHKCIASAHNGDYSHTVIELAHTVFFSSFVLQKIMDMSVGAAGSIKEQEEKWGKLSAFIQSKPIQKIIANYPLVAGPWMTLNQSMSMGAFTLSTLTGDHMGAVALMRAIAAVASGGLTVYKLRKMEKHGEEIDPTYRKAADLLARTNLSGMVKSIETAYPQTAVGALSLPYATLFVQECCNPKNGHINVPLIAAPLSAMFGYVMTVLYYSSAQQKTLSGTENGHQR